MSFRLSPLNRSSSSGVGGSRRRLTYMYRIVLPVGDRCSIFGEKGLARGRHHRGPVVSTTHTTAADSRTSSVLGRLSYSRCIAQYRTPNLPAFRSKEGRRRRGGSGSRQGIRVPVLQALIQVSVSLDFVHPTASQGAERGTRSGHSTSEGLRKSGIRFGLLA